MKTKNLLAGVLTLCVMGASFVSTIPVSAQDMGDAIVQTAESPVNELSIGSKDEFAKFMTVPEYWSNNTKVKLTCNIDMEGAIFKPIEKFSGEFDGCGYNVSNLKIEDISNKYKNFELAFIKILDESAQFKNVTFDNYSIKDTGSYSIRTNFYKAAGFVLNNKGYISYVNFKNSSMIKINNTFRRGKAAGFVLNNKKANEKNVRLVSFNNTSNASYIDNIRDNILIKPGLIKDCSIQNCSVDMNIENSNIDAGFVYKNSRTIQNCKLSFNAECTTNKESYVGGFCGKNLGLGTIIGCESSGSLKADKSFACGGFLGVNYGKVKWCNSKIDVTANRNVGGFVGINEKGTITVCTSTGSVKGKESVGGFAGVNRAKIVRSNAMGKATAKKKMTDKAVVFNAPAGGFVGKNEKGEISNCNATGGARSEADLGDAKAGGFVGVNEATITNSNATGDVYLSAGFFCKDDGCGGFVGQNAKNGDIDGCYAECKVETTNHNKGGGFVGEAKNNSKINNSTCRTLYIKGYKADGSAILEKAEFCYHKSKKAVIKNEKVLDGSRFVLFN